MKIILIIVIREIAGECFMPLSYGGGINNIETADKPFSLGIEKLCLNKRFFI